MRLQFTHGFKKQYAKLPTKIQIRFQERLRDFVRDEFDPTLNNHKLDGEFASFRSINVTGDYRALYQCVRPDMIIWALIGTHSQLYD